MLASDILVIGSPIWPGEKSSICTRVIERLYGTSGDLNEHGQYVYYGRVGGCLITGNEDGVKHCSMRILYALQHLGFAVPPTGGRGMDRRRGPGPVLSRSGIRRTGDRLHQSQHDVHDLEPASPSADA